MGARIFLNETATFGNSQLGPEGPRIAIGAAIYRSPKPLWAQNPQKSLKNEEANMRAGINTFRIPGALPSLQSLAVKKNFFLCKFWAVKNFQNLVKNGR